MKIYFSTKYLDFSEIEGCHFIQDHIGTNYGQPWNDYDYYVTFKVYFSISMKSEYLGICKILVKDFMDSSKYFLQGKSISQNSFDVTSLFKPELVVSLSSEMDYYRKLIPVMLDVSSVDNFLEAMCDASFFIEKETEYRKWPGFQVALLRSGSASEAALRKGSQIAIGKYEPENQFIISLENLPETFEPIDFSFSNLNKFDHKNINILIGPNGVGKTHILRAVIQGITGIDKSNKPWPYFHKVVAIAYSPFEDYYTKDGVATKLQEAHFAIRRDSKQKKLRRRLNVNAYAYVGFRDNTGQFSLAWPLENSIRSLIEIQKYDKENQWWGSTSKFSGLIAALSMHIDFSAIGLKHRTNGFIYLDKDNFLIKDINIDTLDLKNGISFFKGDSLVPLSSGQRMYSYMLPSLLAEIEEESLVIIDEPELYLHPSLEIALLDMLKKILNDTNSYAIIATHSPVMVREVDKTSVRILRKENGKTVCLLPSFETRGESLDLIAGEVFDDYYTRKPYQNDIDEVIEENGPSQALELLKQKIGDEALTYVMSKIDEQDSSAIIIGVVE
ncbi:putative AbiEii toxin of type IV toxin-antitoxin system [Collimonas sp. PA-H2]|uniref:AAA family ATPase n=1 Tax=Collimonas sp. PA-H2 TaxID=1881062 RepID=UPI000BF605A3|nr:AAA family ATPase [Collimonas sp. PA-H2]PFH09724.1 putative AbiEii toxin of type IV toxin-antitoxin system [Collimonas sp. PA-H2]